jgi:iron(III) transport system ATP-binding protein
MPDHDEGQALARLSLESVTKRFGSVTAVDDLTLHVEHGEVVVLLGPSGCGKTTLLRLLAGFERQDAGAISIDGEAVADGRTFVPPDRRPINVVFQSYALWPHMTVFDNVAFGPRLDRKRPASEVDRLVKGSLDLVELSALGDRYPHEISGGQQQRVALARALVGQPSCLLLDEPLSNLDTRLREDMRIQLKRIQRELGLTTVYVTHDPVEALSLADRIVALHAGRIEQIGTPQQLYHHPSTRFVAASLGSVNFLDGTVVAVSDAGTEVQLAVGPRICVRTDTAASPRFVGDAAVVSVRPSAVGFVPPREDGERLTGGVAEKLFFGDYVQYLVDVPGLDTPLRTTGIDRGGASIGERVDLAIDPDLASILPAGG